MSIAHHGATHSFHCRGKIAVLSTQHTKQRACDVQSWKGAPVVQDETQVEVNQYHTPQTLLLSI